MALPPESPAAGVALKTLLLTDLVGSTHLVETLGDVLAYEVSASHDRQARDLLARHGGREIDKTDGFLLLFDHPIDALRFALAYHEELSRMSASRGVELAARVGIHLGEVFLRENSPEDVARGAKPLEVEGLAKPMAARLMSLAQGGQTLLSQEAYEVSRRRVGSEGAGDGRLKARHHGAYRFKGVAEPVEVYEIGREGRAPLIPPPDSEKAHRIDGAGESTGSWSFPRTTRGWWRVALTVLALLIVASLVLWQLYPQGLGKTRPAVAVLGFRSLSPQPESEWLATALAEMFATELAAGEDLRLISGENVARMHRELDLPLGETLAADTLEQIRNNLGTDYVVVGSYVFREGALEPLQVQLQDTRHGEIVFSLGETGRQEELYQLVSRVGTALRRSLGLGGISSAEAEAVRATLSASPEATRLYSEGLVRLRDYDALAARDLFLAAVAADPGYALAHASLSQAWSQLGYDARAEESARRASELARGLPREDQLIIEGRYYETAGEWAKAEETYGILWGYHPDDVDHGLRLVRAETGGGRNAEALAMTERLRGLPEPARSDPRIDAAEARIYWQLSDYEKLLTVSAAAVLKAEARETSILQAEILLRRGWTFTRLGRYREARQDLEEARRLFSDAGDRAWATRVQVSLAILAKYQGDLVRAEELYQQALVGLREIGHQEAVTTILNNLAVVARETDRLDAAHQMLDEALSIAEEIGNRSAVALTHENRTLVLLNQGRLAEAHEIGQQAVDIYTEIGERSGTAWVLWDLGQVTLAAGDLLTARPALEQALNVGRELSYQHLIGQTLTTLGRLYTVTGDLDAAQAAFVEAVDLRTRLGENGTLAETRLARCELLLALGQNAQAAAVARSTLEQFDREGKVGLRLEAVAVLTEALLAQGQPAAARAAFATSGESARGSESPLVRLRVALAEASLRAATGEPEAALEELRASLAEAQQMGLLGFALEARLASGEIELATGHDTRARSELESLVREARERGHELLARRADALLASLPPL